MRTVHQIKQPKASAWSTVSVEEFERAEGVAKRVRQLPRIKQDRARQAIITSYRPYTSTKPARILAKADAGKTYATYDTEPDAIEDRHRIGANALAAKFGWDKPAYYGPLACGALPDGKGYAFVEMPISVDALLDALGDLVQYAVGNRGERAGNPYGKPEVMGALEALHFATTGRKADSRSDVLNAADAWRVDSE